MASPSPVPPYLRVVDPSTWVNMVNRISRRSAGDSDARIPDGETKQNGLFRFPFDPDADVHIPFLGEFHGVAHQVDDNLAQDVRDRPEETPGPRDRPGRSTPTLSRVL